MPDDIAAALARLIEGNQVETATITVVLRPPPAPPPPDLPTCVFKIGPVSSKQ